jgi:small subunit ribosomal protein S1
MRRVRDLRPYLGRELDAKIIEMDRNRGNVVLSRRAWLEANRPGTRSELLSTLSPKQVRKGVVSSIAAFGVFVDLGGVDGLVHVSQLSWKHVDHPSEVVGLGQEVLVEVLEVDQERGRVSLSMRATQEDPWHAFARVRSIGQLVPGRVTKLVPFGAFVRLEDGVEGLVHISELTEERIERPEDVIRPGAEVVVKIVDLDVERRRIRLSLRQADDEYAEDEAYFDPARYGMAATYDAAGAYIYPEGFDAATGDWLDGFEEQREAWEADYARAYEVWQLHGRQVRDGIGPGVDAAPSRPAPTPVAAAEPVAEPEPDSPQSVDEALAQLRERLSKGRDD